jgi:hypothetical protein
MTPAQIEQLIDKKIAPVLAVIARYDALMGQVHALLTRIEAAFGAAGAAGAGEQFNKLRSLVATLETVVALKASQAHGLESHNEELARVIAELHQLTAAAHEKFEGRKQ